MNCRDSSGRFIESDPNRGFGSGFKIHFPSEADLRAKILRLHDYIFILLQERDEAREECARLRAVLKRKPSGWNEDFCYACGAPDSTPHKAGCSASPFVGPNRKAD